MNLLLVRNSFENSRDRHFKVSSPYKYSHGAILLALKMFLECNIPRGSELRKCRLCLASDKLLIYIFEVSGSLMNVARTISDVLNYEVAPDDRFPPFVCTDCSDKLDEFKAFKVKCGISRETYKLLQNSKAESEKVGCFTLKRENEEHPNSNQNERSLFIETGQNLCTMANGGSSMAELIKTRAILERNLTKLNCDENLKTPLKLDLEEQEVPICDELLPVIIRAFSIEAEQTVKDAKTDGTEQNGEQQSSKDRPLRCRKVIDYKQYQSDSDATDSVDSDQHSRVSSDDSFSLGRDVQRRKKLKNCGDEVDTGTSGKNKENDLLSGTVVMEKIYDEGNNSSVFDLRAVAIGNTAVPSLNEGFSRGNVNSALQSSGFQLSSSRFHQGSVVAHKTTIQSNLGHSTVDSIQSIDKVSTALVAKHTANDYSATDNRSISNFTLVHSDKNYAHNECLIESHQSKSIALENPLEFEELSAKSKSPLRPAVSDSLADVFVKEVLPNNNKSGKMQYKKELIDAMCTLESTVNLDSAGSSQSLQFSDSRERQTSQSGIEAQLHRRISMLDLKSFGISLEKENDDAVSNDDGGSNLQGEHQILGINTESEKHSLEQESAVIVERTTLHKDQRSVAERSMDSDGMEENRKEMFDVQALEHTREVARDCFPCSMQSMNLTEDSSLNSLQSIASNFSYGTGDRGMQTRSVNSTSNLSNVIAVASHGPSRFHQTLANSSNVTIKYSYPYWESCPSGLENSEEIPTDPANNIVACIHNSVHCVDTSKVNICLGGYNGTSGEDQSNNTNTLKASSSQGDLGNAKPITSSSYNHISHCKVNQGITNRDVVNHSIADACNTSNNTHSSISGNLSTISTSACDRSLQILSANNMDLSLPTTSRNNDSPPNLVSDLELEDSGKDVEDEWIDSALSTTDKAEINDIEGYNDDQRTVKGEYTKERLCELCGKVYADQTSLVIHQKGVHGEKKFNCNKCPKTFTMKTYLIQHLAVHDESRPFSCKECGKSFKVKAYLRQHAVVHSKMYQCVHCELCFRNKWQHNNHQKSHEGKVVWSCEGCPEKSKTWAEYVSHLQEHNKSRMYKCEICQKDYNSKLSLKKHIETHTKPFECSVCRKQFGKRFVLRSHMRIHTGERPYVCKVCGKTYPSSAGLFHHMLTHSKTKRFKCQFCDLRTNLKRDLKRHEARKHPKLPN